MDHASRTTTRAGSELWQTLLHRWFVQYNPIYLVSATLVLGGMLATSRGLAHEGSLYGPLGVALVAEIYACSLIAGAALLTRIGQRRPAVMLALITVLYQSDLTLHTETCAFLGTVGVLAALAWLVLFVGKLYALAWALRTRLAPRAVATATFGALGLTLAPHLVARLDARASGAALALFVFALGSLYPSGPEQAASSVVPLDDWGRTVLRRVVRATWLLWAVLLGLHFLFLSSKDPIDLAAVVPALALLGVRRLRTEARVWAVVLPLLAAVFLVAPAVFSTCAFLAALALVHRALSRSQVAATTAADSALQEHDRSPYRAPGESPFGRGDDVDQDQRRAREMREAARTAPVLVRVDATARARLLSGALFGFYLSAWTLGWTGGPLPAHVLALDLSLIVVAALLVWRLRARLVLAPLVSALVHGALASGLVPEPRSLLEWGGAAMSLGFVLLLGSLALSYRLRHVVAPGRESTSPPPR